MLQDWNSEKTKRKRIGNQSTKAQQRCFQRKHENWGCGWFYLIIVTQQLKYEF